MGAIFGILSLVCILAAIIGWIWLLVVIFSDGGVLWGIGSVIFGIVGLIYVAMNWGDRVKKPFLICLLGGIGASVFGMLGGGMAGG